MSRTIFNGLILALAVAGASAAVAQEMPPPPPGRAMGPGGDMGPPAGPGGVGMRPRGRVFISPMGEPFRSLSGEPEPQDKWFDQADADHDGKLSYDEFQKDATRFFTLLDTRKDGEIDPDDIERYETVIAPEVRAAGGPAGTRDIRNSSDYGRPTSGAGTMILPTVPRRSSGPLQGAARFGYFSYPEPVTVADRNFNRGVDPREFAKAAEARFDLLDTNHDGKLEKGELPQYDAPNFGGDGGGRGERRGPPGGARPADKED